VILAILILASTSKSSRVLTRRAKEIHTAFFQHYEKNKISTVWSALETF
jgi:hypothetical protein